MLDHDIKALFTKIAGLAPQVVIVKAEDALTKPDYNQCTRVILHKDTDPAVVALLPTMFAKEPVEYQIQADAQNPDCGQVGHVCACGTKTPKPQ